MRRVVLLLVVLGAIGLAAPGGAAAETKCPFTFRVEHNDRIGSLQLPAGNYNIFVINQAKLSCAEATDLFRQFLEDWDGRLPRPWINVKGTATFTRGSGSDVGFRVARVSGGGGGGGGGGHGSLSCPSFFTVLHNDHIGRFRIAKGPYRITLLSARRLSCARAARLFASFLQDYNGRLSGGWILDRETGTFSKGRNFGFRIKAAVGPPVNPNGPVYPSNGSVCPSFRVLHNDRIGRLRLRRGPYILTRLRGSGLTCSRVARLFRSFLNDFEGNLPRPWIVQTQTGTFRRGRGSRVAFRVKPAR